MKRFYLLLTCLSLLGIFIGCNNKVPKDFPKTVTCQVTVTDAGSPIEGAVVGLVPDQSISSVAIGGTTDASGKAMIRTQQASYSQAGAPTGSYTVTITKTLPVDMPTLSDDEFYKQTPQQKAARDKEYKEKLEKARIVPEKLGNLNSPLKLQVESSGGSLNVDISEYKK